MQTLCARIESVRTSHQVKRLFEFGRKVSNQNKTVDRYIMQKESWTVQNCFGAFCAFHQKLLQEKHNTAQIQLNTKYDYLQKWKRAFNLTHVVKVIFVELISGKASCLETSGSHLFCLV